MKFIISGKNIEVTEGIKAAIEEKLGRLDKYLVDDTVVNVTLSVQKGRQKIEVTIPMKGHIIRAEEGSEDMYVSIDLVVDVIERQIRRYKKKLIDKKQAAIAFSQAFIEDEDVKADFDVIDDAFPTIYRIDRIAGYKVLDKQFKIPYGNRFKEGEFRKRIQFMYGGKLQKVKFRYKGSSVEAVLDRLPTAKILEEKDGVYTISAEVFGKGIDMWLRSQGDMVEVI